MLSIFEWKEKESDLMPAPVMCDMRNYINGQPAGMKLKSRHPVPQNGIHRYQEFV